MRSYFRHLANQDLACWLIFFSIYSGFALKEAIGAIEAPYNAKIYMTSQTGTKVSGDNRFGVMTHFAQGWNPDWISNIREGGLGQVRDELYWAQVESEKGIFKFPASFDTYMAALKQNQISPLIILSFENPLYDGGNTPYTQDGFDGYTQYALEVLRHYGSQVKAVEIWNEYNGSFNHGPASADRAATYVKMLRTVYAAIKRERPDVIVVGGATAGVPLPYWEKIMAAGGLDSMDALSIHPYRYTSAPEGIEDDITDLQRLILQYNNGAPKPIWVTEIGWYIKPSLAPGDLLVDEAVQAKFLVRAYALLFSAEVQHVYWYLFRDYQTFTMGLVHDDDARTRKPAFTAMATMIQQLKDAHFVRREKTPDDLYSLLFQNLSSEEVRVLWSITPRHLALTGATAGVAMAGEPLVLGESIDLNDSPIYLTGPVRGLPPAPVPEEIIADSKRDFGATSINGWSYGTFSGGKTIFVPLPTYALTDWKAEWTGVYPYVSITSVDQHPSYAGGLAVTAVRRWKSNYEGAVQVTGTFHCGTDGDGVGVGFNADGVQRFRTLLGGGAAVVKDFEMVETVHAGTTLDFTVDPGPVVNIDFDATSVSVVIRKVPQ